MTLALSSLYLDPNNYRFIDHDDYSEVPEDQLTDDEVQRRSLRFILGQNEANVSDLIASLGQNGWLDIEPIHVRKLSDRKYLVVEGNRRVATLKHLQARWTDSTGQLGKLDPDFFDKVPCILYEERDDFHHLVVMGLHHISGKARWPAVNQARLMRRLRDEFKKHPDEICASLGVSKREFNLSLRTLALADAYRASDYGDQFTTEMFNLFREVLKAPSLRDWLDWDNDTERAQRAANLERLFSWLSREPDDEPEDEEEDLPRNSGRVLGERVITSGQQIRELAKIIEDPSAVKRLEETRSLLAASLSSDLLVKNEIEGAIERSHQDAARLFELAPKMSSSELDRVEDLVARLEAVAVSRKRQPETASTSEQPWRVYDEAPRAHFDVVAIGRYRALNDIRFEGLGRVNLIVGINNAGKTSVLEAVYLLANQSDPRGLLELLRRRTRLDATGTPAFAVTQLPPNATLGGRFGSLADNELALQIAVLDQPEDKDEDWASYLRTLTIDTSYAGQRQHSATDFFAGRSRRTRLTGDPRWLCSSVFHSPFSLSDPDLLARCYEESIRLKLKERVVDFIRSQIDPGVRDVALANEHRRFLVTHDDFGEAVDLSSFGEGIQRVFLTGLLFAGARGGVVLIDEFENALHTGVLMEFTRFVHQLAIEFACQVFLTTHSKETVDAFLMNGYGIDEIVSYLLKREESGKKSVIRFSGPDLKRAVEIGDVDLRRL
ncbi:AAA family ATPase [Mitsuaria sp. CC2]|uniref:AAA family ATPase n=1 Tax=Mitsuaria sp. CC2 TaxID=3029186 RepID=UPI003B8D0DA8